jgi:hypothetical protein
MGTIKNLSFVKLIVVIAFLSAFVISCKKEKNTVGQPDPTLPPDPPAPTVLLKEIVIPNLPSPYYHFEYDATGRPIFVSFASDLTRYDLVYDADGKLIEMRNNILVNKDTLRYFYDNSGKVVAVNYIDMNGMVYIKLALTYEGKKLKTLERKRILGSDFVVNKTLTFSYHNDGNLKQIVDHRPAVNGMTESTDILSFDDYDSNINVDGFSLLHGDFFDHLVLLPGVRLQINNPRKEMLFGFNSYTLTYTYTYDEKHQPISKRGDVLFTGGPVTGQRFQTNSAYTYY